MERIVDISTDGLHLATHRGFLTVSASGEEKGRIALDDVGALSVHAHGTTWSNALVVRLSERAVPVVVCDASHAPVACVWPLEGHHAQAARMRAQIAAPRPLTKQAWRQIVVGKVRMQGEVLAFAGLEGGAFEMLARKVRSGDPQNVEAQAARRYWKVLFGPGFGRDREAGGTNAMLNYGYAVLRAIVSRAICAAGLHPTLGVFHSNRTNAFALADDLMEPFRPIVDLNVRRLAAAGCTEVSPEVKRELAKLSAVDLVMPAEIVSPLGIAVQRLVQSLAAAYETRAVQLVLPARPAPGALAADDDDVAA